MSIPGLISVAYFSIISGPGLVSDDEIGARTGTGNITCQALPLQILAGITGIILPGETIVTCNFYSGDPLRPS